MRCENLLLGLSSRPSRPPTGWARLLLSGEDDPGLVLCFAAKRPQPSPSLGSRVKLEIEIERREVCSILEMGGQASAVEMSRRNVCPTLLSSLTFIDTYIGRLRGNVLLTAFLGKKRRCRNKNAVNPTRSSAFPGTYEVLQVVDRDLSCGNGRPEHRKCHEYRPTDHVMKLDTVQCQLGR